MSACTGWLVDRTILDLSASLCSRVLVPEELPPQSYALGIVEEEEDNDGVVKVAF